MQTGEWEKAQGWGVRGVHPSKSIYQNPPIKILSIKIHWFKIHWYHWAKYPSVLVLLFQCLTIPNLEIAADNNIIFFNSNCSAMDKTLEFSSRLFSILKIQMEQSLKQDKFKEEIHQEAEQMAFFDRSQISFIQLLINIGKMYTIVS
jgi:hypothetical protein